MARLVLSSALVALFVMMACAQCPTTYAPVIFDSGATGDNSGFTTYDLGEAPLIYLPFNFKFFTLTNVTRANFEADTLFFYAENDLVGTYTFFDTKDNTVLPVPGSTLVSFQNSSGSMTVYGTKNYTDGMRIAYFTTIYEDGIIKTDYVTLENITESLIFPPDDTNKVNALTYESDCTFSNINNGTETFPTDFPNRFKSGLIVMWCHSDVLKIPQFGTFATNQTFSVPIVFTADNTSRGCEAYIRIASVSGGHLLINGVNMSLPAVVPFNSTFEFFPSVNFAGTAVITARVQVDLAGNVFSPSFDVQVNVLAANMNLLPPNVVTNNGATTIVNTPLTGIAVSSANNGTEHSIFIERVSVFGGSLRLAASNATISNGGQYLTLSELAGGLIFVPDLNFTGTVVFRFRTSSNGNATGLGPERLVSFVVTDPPTPTPSPGTANPAATFNFIFSNMFVV